MSNHADHNGTIEVPKTMTPSNIYSGLGGLVAISFGMITTLLFPFLSFASPVWAFLITMVLFGATTSSGVIALDIPDWEGAEIFNPWAKTRRAMFPGFHWKLPWEHVVGNLESLKREIPSEKPGKFTTNDPAETMDVTILVLIKIDTSGTPQEASDKFIRRVSISDHDLEHLVTTEVRKMFGQHYASNEMEELLKLDVVQETVLKNSDNDKKLKELQKKYGVHIGVVLQESGPDEKTKETKRTVGRAEALRTAIGRLVADGPEKLDIEAARRATLLLDPNADFTEHRTDWDVTLNATGVENLRDINIIPPGSFEGKGKGKK